MGRIARILSFVRSEINGAKVSDVKSDPGGGPNTTSQHFQPAGDDAHPLPGDYVATSPAAGTGRETAVGYLDPANKQKAGPGEKRLYARDSAGAQVCEVWLKADGSVLIQNETGSTVLNPDGSVVTTNEGGVMTFGADGSFTVTNAGGSMALAASGVASINGATITEDGDFVTSDGVSLRDHKHIGNLGSPTSQPI